MHLTNGSRISTEFVILATGQTPNNGLVQDLVPSTTEPLINPNNGFIRIRPTMQFRDPQYSNLFAVGDIADTGLRKAARPGSAQAAVVAQNIQAMIEGRSPQETFPRMPAAIHLTLGMVRPDFLVLAVIRTLIIVRNTTSSSETQTKRKGKLSRRLSKRTSE